MHRIEDIFSLNLNREMLFFALFLQKCGKSVKGQLTVGNLIYRKHYKSQCLKSKLD